MEHITVAIIYTISLRSFKTFTNIFKTFSRKKASQKSDQRTKIDQNARNFILVELTGITFRHWKISAYMRVLFLQLALIRTKSTYFSSTFVLVLMFPLLFKSRIEHLFASEKKEVVSRELKSVFISKNFILGDI